VRSAPHSYKKKKMPLELSKSKTAITLFCGRPSEGQRALQAAELMALHLDMEQDRLLALFFPECPTPWVSDEIKRAEAEYSFHLHNHENIVLPLLFCLWFFFFISFFPNPTT
jgi:hypothetical protein